MKPVYSILAAIATGLLAGGLVSGFTEREPETASVRKPMAPAPAAAGIVLQNRSPVEEVTECAARPAGIRNAIRLERALLRLDATGALQLLTEKKVRTDGFSGMLLGWIAAGIDPAAAFAVVSRVGEPPVGKGLAGILRRWLTADPAAALAACEGDADHFAVLCHEWAQTNPAACAAGLRVDDTGAAARLTVMDLLHNWGALDPLAARIWAAKHFPKGISDVFRGWMLADPGAALSALSAEEWGASRTGRWLPANDWLANAFSALTGANPEYAASCLFRMDGTRLSGPLTAGPFMLGRIATVDSNLCVELSRQLSTPELRDTARVASASEMFRSDPDGALALIEKCETGTARTSALSNFIHALGELDPWAADPLLDRLPLESRRTAVENLLLDFEASAPDLARKWGPLVRPASSDPVPDGEALNPAG